MPAKRKGGAAPAARSGKKPVQGSRLAGMLQVNFACAQGGMLQVNFACADSVFEATTLTLRVTLVITGTTRRGTAEGRDARR